MEDNMKKLLIVSALLVPAQTFVSENSNANLQEVREQFNLKTRGQFNLGLNTMNSSLADTEKLITQLQKDARSVVFNSAMTWGSKGVFLGVLLGADKTFGGFLSNFTSLKVMRSAGIGGIIGTIWGIQEGNNKRREILHKVEELQKDMQFKKGQIGATEAIFGQVVENGIRINNNHTILTNIKDNMATQEVQNQILTVIRAMQQQFASTNQVSSVDNSMIMDNSVSEPNQVSFADNSMIMDNAVLPKTSTPTQTRAKLRSGEESRNSSFSFLDLGNTTLMRFLLG